MATLSDLKYETDLYLPDTTTPIVATIRASTATTGLEISGDANTETDSDINTIIPARVSGTRRYGITARHLVIYRIIGSGATAYRLYRRVPILQKESYISFISNPPVSVTFEAIPDWQIAGSIAERHHLAYGPIPG